jgi:hypothetical protein
MRNMKDTFTGLDGLNTGDHRDARERDIWPTVATAVSQYEPFWRTLIVLLTNRIEPDIPVGPKWIRLRPIDDHRFPQRQTTAHAPNRSLLGALDAAAGGS